MGILDDAIRQHLDLKRRLGAEEDDVRRLEDEAFGPPSRPGEPDFPEQPAAADEVADDAGVVTLDEPAGGAETAASGDSAEELEGRDPPEFDAPPGAPDSGSTSAEEADASAAAVDEPAGEQADGPPTASHEPDLSLVDHPTMVFDHTAEGEPEPESHEPAEPDELNEEDPFDIESLDLELDAVESSIPRVEPEVEAPGAEAPSEPEPEVPVEPKPLTPEAEPREASFEPEPSTSEKRRISSDPPPEEDAEPEPEPLAPATGEEEELEPAGKDVLDETPEFLRDRPEDDELWFEQGEPKDFDF